MVDPNIEVAGLRVNPFTKQQLLEVIGERLKENKKTFLTTVYSEFLYHALRDRNVMILLNSADISIADGVGIVWADYFLSRPLNKYSFYLRIIQAWFQVIYTGASILLSPYRIYGNRIPEKIVGADLIWDLANLAEANNYSMYLLGSRGEVADITAQKLKARFPKLNIVGTSNKEWTDESIIEDVVKTSPDMLLVAFNPRIQEQWILKHLPNIPVKFAVGLGGTFDYVSGQKTPPPRFIRDAGLEWLYRFVTQPRRFSRIINAFWGLIISLVRYKVFMTYPLRENCLVVLLNKDNQVLLCRRVIDNRFNKNWLLEPDKEYWQFPQGGLNKNERLEEGAKRELFEETGVVSVSLLHIKRNSYSYYWTNALKNLSWDSYKNSGQTQHVVYFRFLGDDSEINLDGRELDAYQWCKISDLAGKVAKEISPHAILIQEELARLDLEK